MLSPYYTSLNKCAVRAAVRHRPAPMKPEPVRCPWPTVENMIRYHDTEWGVPVHDDRLLFEFLIDPQDVQPAESSKSK